MLNVEKKLEDGALLIALEGELDTLSSPDFEDMLEPLLAEAQSLTLDFEKLDYISSAGLRVLLLMEKGCKEGVSLIGTNDYVADILSKTGFTEILKVRS